MLALTFYDSMLYFWLPGICPDYQCIILCIILLREARRRNVEAA